MFIGLWFILFSFFSSPEVLGAPNNEELAARSYGLQPNKSFAEDLKLYDRYIVQPKAAETLNHYAIFASLGDYYGAKATINVYGISEVLPDQDSSAQIWVANKRDFSHDNMNTIEAGWHVNPGMYGDNDTHFFIYWTADGHGKKGCHNLQCPGFVLNKSSEYIPGAKIQPVSQYGGEQYYITLKILKDPKTGDWWLYYGVNGNKPVGYWPKSLFTSLADKADRVEVGGVAGFMKNTKSPPMGSSHFAIEGEGKAAAFRNVQVADEKGDLYDPNSRLVMFSTNPNCYTVSRGDKLYFGGPGGCTN